MIFRNIFLSSSLTFCFVTITFDIDILRIFPGFVANKILTLTRLTEAVRAFRYKI